ncbi:MAG: hypothetical protein R3B07_17385 [Polyangiaceae bacterium]
MTSLVAQATRQLQQECFAVLPGLYGAAEVERLKSCVCSVYESLGSPVPYGEGSEWPTENVEVSRTGLVLHKLLNFSPELQQGLLHPDAVEVVRGVLGERMHLEFVAALICDDRRPFFPWHMHVGGIDDERYRRLGLTPNYRRHERVAMIIYLEEMSEGSGQLLVHPRDINDATEAPHPTDLREWPGQTRVVGPPGTVVMMEQSTWHAVLPRVQRSPRIFVGCWFAADYATQAERADESLLQLSSPDAVLSSVLPRGISAG